MHIGSAGIINIIGEIETNTPMDCAPKTVIKIMVYIAPKDDKIKIDKFLKHHQAAFEKDFVSRFGQPELIKPIARRNSVLVICEDLAQKNSILKSKIICNLDVVVSLPQFETRSVQPGNVALSNKSKTKQFVIKGVADDFDEVYIKDQAQALSVKRF
jgi:hypothetical protein